MTWHLDEPKSMEFYDLDDLRFYFRELHIPCGWIKVKDERGDVFGFVSKDKDGLAYWMRGARPSAHQERKLIDRQGVPKKKLPIYYQFDGFESMKHIKVDSALACYWKSGNDSKPRVLYKHVERYPGIPIGIVERVPGTMFFMLPGSSVKYPVASTGYFMGKNPL